MALGGQMGRRNKMIKNRSFRVNGLKLLNKKAVVDEGNSTGTCEF